MKHKQPRSGSNPPPGTGEELSYQFVPSVFPSRPPTPAPKRRMSRKLKVVFGTLAVVAIGVEEVYLGYATGLGSAGLSMAMREGYIFSKKVTETPPAEGPMDRDLCYDLVHKLRPVFEKNGDIVSPQVEWQKFSIGPLVSPPIFDRPLGIGLVITDPTGQVAYAAPTVQIYNSYKEIPVSLMAAVAYVEDRNSTDFSWYRPSFANRAIDWKRIGAAIKENLEKAAGQRERAAGASGLKIQGAKLKAWEKGRTPHFTDKIEQALMGTIEMSEFGFDTTQASLKSALEYINLVNFAAHPKIGPVRGFKQGMAIWFGNTTYNEVLASGEETPEAALAYRQMLTLVMAVQMPDEVLRTKRGFARAQDRLDSFLPLLDMSDNMRRMVRDVKIEHASIGKNPVLPVRPVYDKSINNLRLDLFNKMGLKPVDGMFVMDKCHLHAETPLVADINQRISTKLTEFFARNGLQGAITIDQVLPTGEAVTRVSTDTYKGAFDLSRSGKQNTGSIEKWRMFITKHMVVHKLHEELSALTPDQLKAMPVHPKDRILRWGIDHMLSATTDKTAQGMMNASDNEMFSDARTGFFTGGGMNYPSNFKNRHRGRISQKEALWESNNLAWYNITDGIEEHLKWHVLGFNHRIFTLDADVMDLRAQKLSEFAEYEGTVFFDRGWKQLKDKSPDNMAKALAAKTSRNSTPLAIAKFATNPDATYDEMVGFIKQECKGPCNLAPGKLKEIYETHAPYRMVDIAPRLVSALLTSNDSDSSQKALIAAYRTVNPAASYQEVRHFLTEQNAEIGPFKDYTKEFAAFAPDASHEMTDKLALLIDKSPAPETPSRQWKSQPEQLAALYAMRHPGSSYVDTQKFILKHYKDKKGITDFKAEYERNKTGKYDAAAVFHKLDLNDRGHLSAHPMWLRVAEMRAANPEIKYAQAHEATRSDRQFIYKWLLQRTKKEMATGAISAGKKRTQDRNIGIMLDRAAWKEIERIWKSMGYPYEVVPSLASVIGVSGDNMRSIGAMNSILLAGGMSVTPTSFTALHFANSKGNPHKMDVLIGHPGTERVMPAAVAAHVLEVGRGNVESPIGTGKSLRGVFKDPVTGQDAEIAGKTGTSADNSTKGSRGVFWAGTAKNAYDMRFSITISAFKEKASASDKFTGGSLATEALKHISGEIQELFNRSYVKATPKLVSENGNSIQLIQHKEQLMPATTPVPPSRNWLGLAEWNYESLADSTLINRFQPVCQEEKPLSHAYKPQCAFQ